MNHFQDDAVSGSIVITPGPSLQQAGFTARHYLDGIDGPTGVAQFSKDLAFELHTVPEPPTGSLVALGVAALGLCARTWREQRERL